MQLFLIYGYERTTVALITLIKKVSGSFIKKLFNERTISFVFIVDLSEAKVPIHETVLKKAPPVQ